MIVKEIKKELRDTFGKNIIIHTYNDKRKDGRRIKMSFLTSNLEKVLTYLKEKEDKNYEIIGNDDYQIMLKIKE
jgi:hypothetical protein